MRRKKNVSIRKTTILFVWKRSEQKNRCMPMQRKNAMLKRGMARRSRLQTSWNITLSRGCSLKPVITVPKAFSQFFRGIARFGENKSRRYDFMIDFYRRRSLYLSAQLLSQSVPRPRLKNSSDNKLLSPYCL